MTDLHPESVWYSQDETSLYRVVVLGTVVFPIHGKYVLYKVIDMPLAEFARPSLTHEVSFRLIYTPMEPPCETQLRENSFSKTTSQQPQPWYSVLRKLWRRVTLSPKKSW